MPTVLPKRCRMPERVDRQIALRRTNVGQSRNKPLRNGLT
jgi:hypothetical protein